MRNVILYLLDTDKANVKHRSVLEDERMNNKKVSKKAQKLDEKNPRRKCAWKRDKMSENNKRKGKCETRII